MTFIADTDISAESVLISSLSYTLVYPSGDLYLRDGMRYRIEGGVVSSIRDRNGNWVNTNTLTDSLNRQVTIAYNITEAPYGLCDKITFNGTGGIQRAIYISKTNLGSVLRPNSGYTIRTIWDLFPLNGASSYTYHDPTVVSTVWLPDGRRYRFFYNSYAELARIELPTGGAIEYDYTPGSGLRSELSYFGDEYQIYRRVIERRVYADGATLESKTTYPINASGDFTGVVNHYNATGLLLARTTHSFNGDAAQSLFYGGTGRIYPDWNEGKETNTTTVAVNNGNNIQSVGSSWAQREPVSWWSWWVAQGHPAGTGAEPANDPRITQTLTVLHESNQIAKQTFTYDRYNNRTDIYEHDYGVGAAPAYATRHTHIDYLGNPGFLTNPVNGATYDNPPPVSPGPSLIHRRNLPARQIVYAVNPANGAETWTAQTNYEYDRYDGSTHHATLVPRANISFLDSAFTTGYTTRGNVTQVDRWGDSGGGGKISTYSQYDIAGNVVKAVDGRGYATTFDFSDRFGTPDGDARNNPGPTNLAGLTSWAFPTLITNALGHTVYTQYDYYLGKPVDTEDPNNVKSSFYYENTLNTLDRPIRAVRAVGVANVQSQTTFSYNDASRTITTTSDRDNYNDNVLKAEAIYDGLGRTTETRKYETATTYSIVKQNYDALGRASQVSNPYRTGDTVLWTTTSYDALGRIVEVKTPDNAKITTAYNGNLVMVRDQARNNYLTTGQGPQGAQRVSETDALGRLRKVWEQTSAGSDSVTFAGTAYTGHLTQYVYNALDNLIIVAQGGTIGSNGVVTGGQGRYFKYDSFSRLMRAKNPEQNVNASLTLGNASVENTQWSMGYDYDNNSNLWHKTDPRNIVTTYSYDALNRNTTVAYSNYLNGSSYIERVYDLATNGKGRPYYSISYNYRWDSDGKPYWHADLTSAYDALGQPTNKWQGFMLSNAQQQATTWHQYNLSRSYNRAGAVTAQTYPSGRTVSYTYDTAGRTSGFTGNIGDGVPRTYATNVQYNAAGQMTWEQFGSATPLYHKLHYNSRLQMVSTRLSSVNDATNWNRGMLINFYGTTAATNFDMFANDADNNGNVRRQAHYVPDNDAISSYAIPELQDYSYDTLNRLTSVSESQMNASGVWTFGMLQQSFTYDRWGNRTLSGQTVDTATNRMTVSSGNSLGYDVAGNQTSDGIYTRSFDVENRLTRASASNGNNYYYYNAEGQRTRRVVGSAETWLVYGFEGELVAEYPVTGTFNGSNPPAASMPQKEYGYRNGQLLVVAGCDTLRWLMTDPLGTPRIESDTTGSLSGIKRHDYLPFGEELFAPTSGTNQRTTARGYTTAAGQDCVRQQFGSHERDNESGLDFMQARYFQWCEQKSGSERAVSPEFFISRMAFPAS